jgi:hypothetical protein
LLLSRRFSTFALSIDAAQLEYVSREAGMFHIHFADPLVLRRQCRVRNVSGERYLEQVSAPAVSQLVCFESPEDQWTILGQSLEKIVSKGQVRDQLKMLC